MIAEANAFALLKRDILFGSQIEAEIICILCCLDAPCFGGIGPGGRSE